MSFRACVVFLAIFLTGCSIVPPLGEATGVFEDQTPHSHKNGIFVADIVKRVKCELSLSFRDKLTLPGTTQKAGKKKGEPLDSWLADWTVKADLTLQANEQGGISPNGSYTAYQKSAVNTVAGPTTSPGTTLGTVSQFFTLSLNANVGEQAVRSETISFTVALKELKDWPLNEAGGCPGEDQRELRGNLGISEWINASLEPVTERVLQAGTHPAPNSASSGGKTPGLASAPSVPKPAQIPGSQAVSQYTARIETNSLDDKTLQKDFPKALEILKQDISPEEKAKRLDNLKEFTINGTKLAALIAPPLTGEELKAAKAKVLQAENDVTDAVTNSLSSYRSIHPDVVAIRNKEDKTTDLAGTYKGVLLSGKGNKIDAGWRQLESNEQHARNAGKCVLQQICGDQYGDCSAFEFGLNPEAFDTGPKKHGVEGANSECKTPDWTHLSPDDLTNEDCTPSSPDDTKIFGIFHERKCVEKALAAFRDSPPTPMSLTEPLTDQAVAAAKQAKKYADVAKKLETYAQNAAATPVPEAPDPPVDSLGHLIEFVVAYGGGISPSWTLIAVKGPGVTTPLISGSINRTHILQLALGSPKGAVSQEQSRILNNQILLNH